MNELTSSAKNIKLKNVDELLYTDDIREEMKKEKVDELPIAELFSFKDHPFKVADDEKMMETVESIRQSGVLIPIIVRERKEGGYKVNSSEGGREGTLGYEIISGHRRKRAAELAGLTKIPAIVKKMTDDEAVIFMVDSNLQRETVLPSEKAFAYKMKLDAMKHQGKNIDFTLSQFGTKLRSDQQMAKESGESRNQIQRYIRLTNLVPELLNMVDEKKMGFSPAVEISFLDEEHQRELLDVMDMDQASPSLSQAQRLKQFYHDGKLDRNVMEAILGEEKPNQREAVKVTFNKIERYIPKSIEPKDYEEYIVYAVKFYCDSIREKRAEAKKKDKNDVER